MFPSVLKSHYNPNVLYLTFLSSPFPVVTIWRRASSFCFVSITLVTYSLSRGLWHSCLKVKKIAGQHSFNCPPSIDPLSFKGSMIPPSFLFRYLKRLVRSLVYLPSLAIGSCNFLLKSLLHFSLARFMAFLLKVCYTILLRGLGLW